MGYFRVVRRQFIFHLILIVMCIITAYPFIWTVYSSLKETADISKKPWALPAKWVWKNYSYAWKTARMSDAMLHSLFVSITTVAIILICASLCAYIFARENKKILKIVYWMFLSSLVIPGTILFLPLYVEINKLNLIGSYWGVILPNVAFGIPFAIFLLTDFVKSISIEVFDSATIDGCSRFQIFYRIVLPLIKTPIQAIIAVQFINVWNDFLLPLLILQDPEKQLVPFTLSSFITGLYSTDLGPEFAAIIISSVPCILIFTFMNRQFVNGFISGAIKE